MLQRLAVALEFDKPLPLDVRRWLSKGVLRFRDKRVSLTLCQALGINKTNAEQREERNFWIQEASKVITLNEHLGMSARAVRLADEIPKFEHTARLLIGRKIAPDTLGSSLHECLYRAKLAVDGADLPTSQWTLQKILKR